MSRALRDRAYRETVHRHGNVTLPASVQAALHVEEGDEVAFVDTGNGIVVCRLTRRGIGFPSGRKASAKPTRTSRQAACRALTPTTSFWTRSTRSEATRRRADL